MKIFNKIAVFLSTSEILLLSIIIFLFILTKNLNGQSTFVPYMTDIVPSLVDGDHTSHGFMVTLADKSIIHFFRLDTGFMADHTGNTGMIVKRTSIDGGATWSHNVPVYSDEYDDRNIYGGMLENGRILVFFRRYEAFTWSHIDCNYIYSDDDGMTWSDRKVITTDIPGLYAYNLTFIPTKGYMLACGRAYYIDIRFSYDGSNFDTIAYKWDYISTQYYYIGEPSFTYAGDGKIVGLFRNNFFTNYQVVSFDYGASWTPPLWTNIANTYYCAAPLLFYHEPENDLWAVCTDRRGGDGTAYDNYFAEIWVYRQHPDDVMNNATNYQLFNKVPRPFPNYYRVFGYPAYAKVDDYNYLVVFAESYKKVNNKEDADLYQFYIKYEEITYVKSLSDKISDITFAQNYPNPCNDMTYIDFEIPDD
ncbi:MAG: exo-alpha-sialidase, partial [Bacteroidia bacterium]|nr:exo-alpha-sialidase [Bacteroidia bacterium]